MKRYGDGPIDGVENDLWGDVINRESWSLTQTKDRLWTTHTLQPESQDDRTVQFEIAHGNGRGYWRNPRLLLPEQYLDEKWTVRWDSGSQVWAWADSDLCLFLSKRVSSSPACREIAIPFANNAPEPCASTGADCIIVSFENSIEIDEIALRIECCEASAAEALQEAERRIILYQMHTIPSCYSVWKSSHFLPCMHIGNCLIIHAATDAAKDQSVDDDRNKYPFDSVHLFLTEHATYKERLFIEANSADIALKNQPGWFVLPMDASLSPEKALESTDFSMASSLNASQCRDLRIEFTRKDAPQPEWKGTLYWKHASVASCWHGLKYIVFR